MVCVPYFSKRLMLDPFIPELPEFAPKITEHYDDDEFIIDVRKMLLKIELGDMKEFVSSEPEVMVPHDLTDIAEVEPADDKVE